MFSGDYSTLERLDADSSKKPEHQIRSVDASTNSLDADDYINDDSLKKVKMISDIS